jgi:hypothetical protein
MMDDVLPVVIARGELFAAAHRRVGCTLGELWIGYVSYGGTLSAFDLEGYLAGLLPMPPGEQDVLAVVLNEQLWDLYAAARLPYLADAPDI